MRWLRVSYIVPRLIALILLLGVAEIGLGYLAQWAMIRGGESMLGARVEVDSVKASLTQTRITVSELVVANPRSAFENLLEAKRIDIDFDSGSLLRKKLIADYGEITGVEFATPRESSGLLPDAPQSEAADPSWVSDEAAVYARNWLNDVGDRITDDFTSDLQSIALAEKLADQWPDRYNYLRTRAEKLSSDAKQLADNAKIARRNPLRHVDYLTQLPQEAARLRQQVAELHTEMSSLPGTLRNDREAIRVARLNDERVLREKLSIKSIDSETLTNYLLGEQFANPLRDTVAWLKWARGLMPSSKKTLAEQVDIGRGEVVAFDGIEQRPNLWLKRLHLAGVGEFAGRRVDLQGTLSDLSDQPRLVGKPLKLELKSSNGPAMNLVAQVDRTGDVPRDVIVLTCQAIPMQAASLGKDGPLQVDLSPSVADLRIELFMVGDRIEGKLNFDQRSISLSPRLTSKRIDPKIQTALAESLERIDQLQTTITITGTLDRPAVKLNSSIGTAVAGATQEALARVIRDKVDNARVAATAKVDAEVSRIESQLAGLQQEVAAKLAAPAQMLAQIIGGQNIKPLDQLGRMPEGSLFK